MVDFKNYDLQSRCHSESFESTVNLEFGAEIDRKTAPHLVRASTEWVPKNICWLCNGTRC